jgi:2-dehydropantoate 2-reductase
MTNDILVWGAGAIGGTLAAHLARAGHDVTVVDTVEAHVEAIDGHGLRITGPIAEFTQQLHAHTPRTLRGQWSTIILATKAHHTEDATLALLPHLTDDGAVISAQNGLNELAVAKIVGDARTVGAFVNFGADYLESGVIHYGGRGAVVVGEIDGRMSPRALAIRDAWRAFDERRDRYAQHLGISVGQGSVRRDAVRHRAHQRLDCRGPRQPALSRPVRRAGA